MLKGVANTSQNGKFVSLLPFLCKLSAIFYDILLLCIRIENNQHLFSFVSYVPHLITCSCTKIQPQPNIFMEFRSSLMCCTICACAKSRFSIKSAVLWFGLSQSLLIPNSMDCHFLIFNLDLLLRLSTHLIYG